MLRHLICRKLKCGVTFRRSGAVPSNRDRAGILGVAPSAGRFAYVRVATTRRNSPIPNLTRENGD